MIIKNNAKFTHCIQPPQTFALLFRVLQFHVRLSVRNFDVVCSSPLFYCLFHFTGNMTGLSRVFTASAVRVSSLRCNKAFNWST